VSEAIMLCTQCGYSHEPANRQRQIKRMVMQDIDVRTVKFAWSCFYPHKHFGDAADRMLYRDINKIRSSV
jgi:hypothetical protein